MSTILPFVSGNLQLPSCKYIYAIRVEHNVDPASSEARMKQVGVATITLLARA